MRIEFAYVFKVHEGVADTNTIMSIEASKKKRELGTGRETWENREQEYHSNSLAIVGEI